MIEDEEYRQARFKELSKMLDINITCDNQFILALMGAPKAVVESNMLWPLYRIYLNDKQQSGPPLRGVRG